MAGNVPDLEARHRQLLALRDQLEINDAAAEETRAPVTLDQESVGRLLRSCGSTVTYNSEALPGITAVAVGAFADPLFPAPSISGFEERRHSWAIVAGEGVDHFD